MPDAPFASTPLAERIDSLFHAALARRFSSRRSLDSLDMSAAPRTPAADRKMGPDTTITTLEPVTSIETSEPLR